MRSWRRRTDRLTFLKMVIRVFIRVLLENECLGVTLLVQKKLNWSVSKKLIRLSKMPVSTGALPIPNLRDGELNKSRRKPSTTPPICCLLKNKNTNKVLREIKYVY